MWRHPRRVSVPQRLSEQFWESLIAELTLDGEGLAPTVRLGQRRLRLSHQRNLVLDVALVGIPDFEGRAGGERVSVGLGDLVLGDLSRCDGDGQRCMDVWRGEEGLVFGVEGDGLERRGRRLAMGVVHHGVALGVVIPYCRF